MPQKEKGSSIALREGNISSLLPNELEIMELLWSEDRPLSRGEIIKLIPYKSWKPSTIHLLLNGLLVKCMIKVVDFTKTVKNYGRRFNYITSRIDYSVMEMNIGLPDPSEMNQTELIEIFQAFLKYNKVDDEQLEKVQKILDELRCS